MNSDKLCATIGKALPLFECSPAPQKGVRVRTPLMYPDGGIVGFKPWRTVAGQALAPASLPELQVLIEGVFVQRRFLALVRDFVAFEDDGSGALAKKMAGYHQFHAVRVAVGETLRAAELQQADERAADLYPCH